MRMGQRPLIDTILEEKPYPIKAAYFILTNPLISYPNSKRTYEALMKLEILVVPELFMTPTAALADIVLPAAWGMESDELGYWPGWYGELRAHPKIVEPPGECWPNAKILNELAKRLGMEEDFWDDDEEGLDEMLEPLGMTYHQFKEERRTIGPERRYERHFYTTRSGKIGSIPPSSRKWGIPPCPSGRRQYRRSPRLPKNIPCS